MEAIAYLDALVNRSLYYGKKCPDTDLYDFGFGETVKKAGMGKRCLCTHSIHATCYIKVLERFGERRIDLYDGKESYEEFHFKIQHLLGLKVRRVALSTKNDLWIDLGEYWVVFVTFENGEESWRFFELNNSCAHLVASDSWLDVVL